ncbi:MAG: DUF7010 family protein [Phycicoccus sp.]
MDLLESLERLAEQNRSGSGFLAAYGVTWLMCSFVWRRASARVAALATLFQGLVAFPAAVGLSALIGAFDQARPVSDEITQLSVLIGSSQLLGLPFVVYLAVRRHHTLVPFALATITSMHFVFYSWLYRAPSISRWQCRSRSEPRPSCFPPDSLTRAQLVESAR